MDNCERQWYRPKIKLNLILARERRAPQGSFFVNRNDLTHIYCGHTIKPKFSMCSLALNLSPRIFWKCMYIQNIYHVYSTLIGRALDRRKVFAWTDFVFEQNYGV